MRPRAEVSWWWWVIGGCVAVRLAFPLAALAAEGTRLPGLPRFQYGPLYGDANGYYAAARELVAAASRAALPLLAVALPGAGLLYGLVRRAASPVVTALAAAAVPAAAATVLVLEMSPSGAPVVGWPLLWALGLAPLRVVDPGFGPDAAFVVGVGISFAAVAATVVAAAYVGLWASGRRAVGMLSAVLFALWPLVPGLVVGERAWENGSWFVDVGLHLYTEPLSTALVVGAVALLLRPAATDLTIVIAGSLLGYATVVKLSDGVIAVGLTGVLLAARRRRQAALVAAAGLVWAPLVVAYWDKGYADLYDGTISVSDRTWNLDYVGPAWGDSLLFSPLLLVLLIGPALVGAVVLRTMLARAIVVVPIVLTVATYSAYYVTALHPRFLYVVLPLALTLDAAGVVAVVGFTRRLRTRSHSVSGESGVPGHR